MTALTTYKTKATTERAAVLRYLKGLREMGWNPVSYSDGEERHKVDAGMTDSNIADGLMSVDAATLYLKKGINGEALRAGIFFLFGNDPWEVAADSSYYDEWNADLKLVEEAINLEGL